MPPTRWDTPPNPAEIGSRPFRLEGLKVQGGGGQIHYRYDLLISSLPGDMVRLPAL